jgi:RNA polymerase sigma-70 factor (ECF subfamily)
VKNANRYKRTAKFTTWLYTIARNLCIDESRRRKHRSHLSLDATRGDDEGGATFKDRVTDHRAESGAARHERARFMEALQVGVDTLPDEQREVFLLRHIEGLKFVEIAEIVGVSENTIKSRMRYALATLRLHVAEFEGVSFDDGERDDIGDADAPEAV